MAYYEPNASDIFTVQQAQNVGSKSVTDAAQGFDLGEQMHQQLLKTQMMHQQVQQKMIENQAAMTNHVAENFNDLATWQDPKSPMWKYKFQQTMQNAKAIGFPVDDNTMQAYLQDPETRNQFARAFGQLSDPSLSPSERAQALQHAVYATGKDPSEITKLADNIIDAKAKIMSAQNKGNNAFEAQGKSIRDQVSKINIKWDVFQTFGQEAKSILDNWDQFETGQAETALKDAYNKAMSGGAPRSFTLAMMDQNRSVGAKIDGYFTKIESGKKLTDAERKDMKKAINIMLSDADQKRDQEIQPYYNAGKALLGRTQTMGYNMDPNTLIPEDQWNRLKEKEAGSSFNNATGKYERTEKPRDAKQIKKEVSSKTYQRGSDPAIDNVVKIMKQNGKPKAYIDKQLSSRGLGKLSQDDYEAY